MKTKIKELWTNALDSNEYSQTTGTLKDEKGYCCLGVLCDLYHKATKSEGWNWDNSFITNEIEYDDYDGSETQKLEEEELPSEVKKWAGIDSALGEFYPSDPDAECESLAKLNDSDMDFKEIAKTIQENF